MQFSAYLGVPGLTDIGLAFYDATETIIGAHITAGLIDAGGGYYEASVTPPTGAMTWRFNSAGTAGAEARGTIEAPAPSASDVATAVATALQTILGAIKAKTDTLGTASVTVVSPVASGGQLLQLERSDDYHAAHNRQLDFAFTNCPVLTGATVNLLLGATTITGTVTGAAAVRFELTHAQTAGIYPTAPNPLYRVRATLPDGDVVTLASGNYEVRG